MNLTFFFAITLFSYILIPFSIAAEKPPKTNAHHEHTALNNAYFAKVDEMVLTLDNFKQALQAAVKQKFYHGNAPQAELAKFQRKVGKDLVNQLLLLREARHLGLKPDDSQFKATVKKYDQR